MYLNPGTMLPAWNQHALAGYSSTWGCPRESWCHTIDIYAAWCLPNTYNKKRKAKTKHSCGWGGGRKFIELPVWCMDIVVAALSFRFPPPIPWSALSVVIQKTINSKEGKERTPRAVKGGDKQRIWLGDRDRVKFYTGEDGSDWDKPTTPPQPDYKTDIDHLKMKRGTPLGLAEQLSKRIGNLKEH